MPTLTVPELVALLRGFDNRREIIKGITRGLRREAPAARKAIRANTLESMPKRGGLNQWLARIRINVAVKLTGYRRVGMTLTGGRNSAGGRSDTEAIDRGRVRAPTFGHKTAAGWHIVAVEPGFFTRPASESGWVRAVDGEVDRVLEQLR
jgi:hypothetical protein